ncbi:hypothetical protein R1sor_009370 [Riccia sorocarpa]|uniref:Uncharacterized protein n=1 Tax=Riccia sorocarpa TaxID=122646 RepID=A0ABD3HYA0_9MARC
MYIRGQSPRSTNCFGSLAPVAPLIPSVTSQKKDDDGVGLNNNNNNPLYCTVFTSVTCKAADHEINNASHLPGVDETDFFPPRRRRFGDDFKTNRPAGIFHFAVDEEEEEDRFVNFASLEKESGLHVQALKQEQQPQTTDSASVVLQRDWSASSSTDSIKSINQEEENGEAREFVAQKQKTLDSNKNALFYRSSGSPQQRPLSASIGLQRKWSDSSCSLESSDQEEDEKYAAPNQTVHYQGLPKLMRQQRKWSSSSGSRDCLDSDEDEDNYQFPPLIEAVRVKEPLFNTARPTGATESPQLSTSSSIGNRSDDSSGSVVSYCDSPRDMEAESNFRGGSASQLNLSSLESSLPIRRGLSKYWNGKAKSFASLQDVSSLASLADLAKPENPYNRRRKLASELGGRSSALLSRPTTAGISKKPPSGTGRSCLAVAVAIGNKLENGPKYLSPQSALRNAQRSFSLSDLEQHGSRVERASPSVVAPATGMRI